MPQLTASLTTTPPVQGATVKKTATVETSTTATPEGSVSASGWSSWPKFCWRNMLFTVFICLIASGGAFAYFSHGSDSLLPSIAVPDATALLPPPPPLSLAEGVFQVRPVGTRVAMQATQAMQTTFHLAVGLVAHDDE